MDKFLRIVLAGLAFAFFPSVQAQIALFNIPVASCAGNVISGTATYSTSMSLATGTSQRIPAADFWTQFGAVWVFSTDTAEVKFGYASIPGVGSGSASIPQAARDAIKLDPSGTAWTLSVPSPTVGEFDIVFAIGMPTSSVALGPTTAAATWMKGGCTVTYAISSRFYNSSIRHLIPIIAPSWIQALRWPVYPQQ